MCGCGCMCAHICVCACMCACVYVYVCTGVRSCQCGDNFIVLIFILPIYVFHQLYLAIEWKQPLVVRRVQNKQVCFGHEERTAGAEFPKGMSTSFRDSLLATEMKENYTFFCLFPFSILCFWMFICR